MTNNNVMNLNCEVCFSRTATHDGACDVCHGLASDNHAKINCPDCTGTGWNTSTDHECDLCVGHGKMFKYDLYEWIRPEGCICSSWHSPHEACRMHGIPADMRVNYYSKR